MNIFNSVFDEEGLQAVIAPGRFLLCVGVAILIGIFLAAIYTVKTNYTKSFLVTLSLLPAVVCVVIMMVNGNVGAGVAVAGAFSLVRFRSAQGTAREIATLFLAMGAGLIAGMGYLMYAVLFAVIMGVFLLILELIPVGEGKKADKVLRITIPEDLNFDDLFDDIIEEYTSSCEEASVKTTNMGSMYRLTYNICMKPGAKEKEFIDALRCRNGNLEISISKSERTEMAL
jgi:hypothetical protein